MINLTTAWVWFDLSHEAGKHIPTVYRTIRSWMRTFMKEKGIKRLQAYIDPDFEEAIRTAEHLGFVWESDMENFDNGKKALMYKKVI